MPKYIFIVGGVMSGIGKGIATSSMGRVLIDRGFKVTAVKIDPYINIDAGTMNPVEHGEVFVTDDGGETDQDLGNYERFLNTSLTKDNYMTTGQVYLEVINKERSLGYNGKCVEVVPHIPEEIIRRIKLAAKKNKADITLIEVGGTVGEYQNLLFLEAGRLMKLNHPKDVIFTLVSYLPIPGNLGEMKTKPTQYATRTLNSAGIQPDIILARAERPIDEPRKEKLSVFCNVSKEDVISAPDVNNIYTVPINFEKEKLSLRILKKFGLKDNGSNDEAWQNFYNQSEDGTRSVKIAIIGKYFKTGEYVLYDSYISVIEAIKHASFANSVRPSITWLDAETYEKDVSKLSELKNFNGLIIPGGFGARGVEGKIKVIEFARLNNIPYFGLCYGLQLAIVEFARNVLGLRDAHTTEVNKKTSHKVIDILNDQIDLVKKANLGGTMRLGAYKAKLIPNSISFNAYKSLEISERHRHRFEVNNKYREALENKGLKVTGYNEERNLVEIMELSNHPFFIGTQFHPELKSRPLNPHPLFLKFIEASLQNHVSD